MNASKLIKSATIAALLSAGFAAGAANAADNGYIFIGFDGNSGRHSGYYSGYDGRNSHDRRWDDRGRDDRAVRYIDRVQAEQRDQIRDGVRSGELTRRELETLRAEQREIERMQRLYLADGQLSRHERQRLLDELEDANRNITRQINDREDRDGQRYPRYGYR